MAAPLATIVLVFGEDVDSVDADSVKIEADSVKNRTTDDDGNDIEKTSFQPEDPYHFLVYHSDSLYISDYGSCAGDVVYNDEVERERSDLLVFTEYNSTKESGNRPSASYQPVSSFYTEWFQGYSEDFNVGTGRVFHDDLTFTISGGGLPAQCNVTYEVAFKSFTFLPPNDLTLDAEDESDSVTIYIAIYFDKRGSV